MEGNKTTNGKHREPRSSADTPASAAASFLSARDAAGGAVGELEGPGGTVRDVPPPFARDPAAARASADAIMAKVRGIGAPDAVPGSRRLVFGGSRRTGGAFRAVGLAAAAVLVAALSSAITVGLIRSAATVDVRFVLVAPEARSVWLAADFNQWSADGHALSRNPDGSWEITVPLRKGRAYAYNFVIDGERWVVDPSSPSRLDDGLGGSSSSLTL